MLLLSITPLSYNPSLFLFYFNNLNIPGLAGGSHLQLAQVSFCHASINFLSISLLCWHKLSQASHRYFFLRIPGIHHSSKELWYLLVWDGIRKPNLGGRFAHCYWCVSICPFRANINDGGSTVVIWHLFEVCAGLSLLLML